MTQFPRIHLNGTSPDDLLDPLHKAICALEQAERYLNECAPHGRDYYTISSTAIDTAFNDHLRRLNRIKDTRGELIDIEASIQEQRDEREKARGR